MVQYIGSVTIPNIKEDISLEEKAKREFESKYSLVITPEKFSMVFVPTPNVLGSTTYALFEIG